ncbi:MAG: UDP-N-acetylmuramate dehydrogenase [Planctomycetaceae bacterium]
MTNSLEDFKDILQRDVPLAKYTWLKVGGPADYVLSPRSRDELLAVVRCCSASQIPVRVLGSGSNLLVSDEGVRGAVIRIVEPLLSAISTEGTRLTAESGALLSHVVSESIRAGLAGMENLVGIPGTIGGALRGNSGGRHGDIGELVRSISVLTTEGEVVERSGDELTFSYRRSSVIDLLILSGTFQLREDDTESLTQRMRKNWIMKRATQPLTDQSAGCIFRNPRGLSAGALIEQCGLKGLAVDAARISDRHANFIVTEDGATASQVHQLISKVQSAVLDKFGVELELEIQTW